MIAFSHSRTTGESLREYGRGIAGGLMFSISLSYTAEMWQLGFTLESWRILVFATATFGILLLYNRGKHRTNRRGGRDCRRQFSTSHVSHGRDLAGNLRVGLSFRGYPWIQAM